MSDAIDRGITVTEMTATGDPVDVRPHTVAAFVGRALRGPLNTPILLRSFAQFCREFGGLWNHSALGPAVEQYFEHGGSRLYVVRVANNARGAMLCLPAEDGVLVLTAVDPGSTERIRVSVDYDGVPDTDSEHFNLTVQRIASPNALVVDQEIYTKVSCTPSSRRFVGDLLLSSLLVRAKLPAPKGRPKATIGPQLRFSNPYIEAAQRGDDGLELTDYDLIGSSVAATGLFALNSIDELNLLYLPPTGRHRDVGPAALIAAERYCRKRGAMLIADPPAHWSTVREAIAGVRADSLNSANMLTYYPRLAERGAPSVGARCVGGAIAGLLSRMDADDGPWESLDRDSFRLRRRYANPSELSIDEQAELNRHGINVIVANSAGRSSLRGDVTTAGGANVERRFADLPLRRLCLHIANTVEQATRWAVFRPGDPTIAHHVRSQVHAFMTALAEEGAFGDERFEVHCDSGLHLDASDPERGVTILLSFRPRESQADIWLTLHQTAAGFRVSTTAFAPAAVA